MCCVDEACAGIPVPEARCHRLTVYENQTARRGRTISLRIVVLPATGINGEPRSDDAVVYLAGGPGQAATEFLGDSVVASDGARARRDIVLCRSAWHWRFEPAPLSVLRPAGATADLLRRVSPDRESARVPRHARTDLGPVAGTRPRLSGGSRGDQGRVEIPAAHAGRRVVRDAPGDGVPQAIRVARPRGRARKSGDASDPRARAIRAIRAARARRAARRMSRERRTARARFPRSGRRRGRSSTGCGRVR